VNSATVCAAPALATGARFTSRTEMVTVDAALAVTPSLTTSRKVRSVAAVISGAVKVGRAVVADDSVAVGPAVWVHA
jgi:hypothetical protein